MVPYGIWSKISFQLLRSCLLCIWGSRKSNNEYEKLNEISLNAVAIVTRNDNWKYSYNQISLAKRVILIFIAFHYFYDWTKLKKCSEFNLVSLFTFLSKHKALCKQNFLEHFSNKDLKTLHRRRLIINWNNWNIFIIHFEQLHESSGSLKTINTMELLFKSSWSHYIVSWSLWSTDR